MNKNEIKVDDVLIIDFPENSRDNGKPVKVSSIEYFNYVRCYIPHIGPNPQLIDVNHLRRPDSFEMNFSFIKALLRLRDKKQTEELKPSKNRLDEII